MKLLIKTRDLLSDVCNASDNCQGDNYGAKIEEYTLLPGLLSIKLPWLGAAKHKELKLRHKSMVSLLNVVRDMVLFIQFNQMKTQFHTTIHCRNMMKNH
jgi:hypothetical protein